MNQSRIGFVIVSACLLAACGGSIEIAEDGSEQVGEADGMLLATNALNANALNANALNANALNANALNANALNANALNANALNANALSADALAAIQDPGAAGALSRQLLQYTVSCALDSTQSFTFSWTDSEGTSHDEAYPGLLGIEPAWAGAPLGERGQLLISACLASRVNYYGVHVIISARSDNDPLRTVAGSDEVASYSKIEGAFWGNLFSETPWVKTCFYGENVAHSRSKQRDCAAGHLNGDGTTSECGIIEIVGDCSEVCDAIDADGYYPSCDGASAVITTALDP